MTDKEREAAIEAIKNLPDGEDLHLSFPELRSSIDDGYRSQVIDTDDLKALVANYEASAERIETLVERLEWIVKACTIDRDAKHALEELIESLGKEATTEAG